MQRQKDNDQDNQDKTQGAREPPTGRLRPRSQVSVKARQLFQQQQKVKRPLPSFSQYVLIGSISFELFPKKGYKS